MPFTLSNRNRRALEDIRAHIEFATSFVDEIDEQTFYCDMKTILAVTRCLEIISEASRRLSAAFTDLHSDIPWREIASAGNVYRHEYDGVAPSQLWHTVKTSLSPLLKAAVAALNAPS